MYDEDVPLRDLDMPTVVTTQWSQHNLIRTTADIQNSEHRVYTVVLNPLNQCTSNEVVLHPHLGCPMMCTIKWEGFRR